MKRLIFAIVVILLLSTVVWIALQGFKPKQLALTPKQTNENPVSDDEIPLQTIIAQGLDTPWAIAFLPNKDMLVTERPGRVRIIEGGTLNPKPVATLSSVKEIGEGGLLGIALDPNFQSNNYVYLYYTYSSKGGNTLNRVVRMTYANGTLSEEKILTDAIPGSGNHNGGRIKFGPDGYLYVTTGDAENPSQAQNKKTLGGKILRITSEGNPAPGNPFGNSVYSYGHRNPQGITWDQNGTLWETEHGRSIPVSGLDEINIIKPGNNYGWPTIQGNEQTNGLITPVKNSGVSTWAPSGTAFYNGSLYIGGLRGQALFEAKLKENSVIEFKEHLKNVFGRIREVTVGPDNMLYITTSNNDGRGTPKDGDDKVIRINPAQF